MQCMIDTRVIVVAYARYKFRKDVVTVVSGMIGVCVS